MNIQTVIKKLSAIIKQAEGELKKMKDNLKKLKVKEKKEKAAAKKAAKKAPTKRTKKAKKTKIICFHSISGELVESVTIFPLKAGTLNLSNGRSFKSWKMQKSPPKGLPLLN
jgi:hypothetical protein